MNPFAKVIQSLLSSDPTAVAQAVETLSPTEAEDVLRDLPANELAGVVERLESSFAVQVLERADAETRAGALSELPSRVAALLLRRMTETGQAETLQHASRPFVFGSCVEMSLGWPFV